MKDPKEMIFADLNIPYLESQGSESSRALNKKTRLKLVVKAIELGYSGIAYNRLIKGVVSESDRCQISLFPLSSLLNAAPILYNTVQFHRKRLGVRLDSPFRQYTRLTVAIETAIHAAALNRVNPIIKTYDLVAIRPLNQAAFDEACKVSEVDLISIDFSLKLPFRLKFPMIKAAVERGLYFEITYSHLISECSANGEVLSGAQLLIDWTRGKNIILSSAAPTANELRGPYDAANLSSLFGLSMERAKQAISKNCRLIIAGALRKKEYYKEAIKIEQIPDVDIMNSKGNWFGNWHGWDPISSGEGDLSLDDIGKFLAATDKTAGNSHGADAVAIGDETAKGFLHSKDWPSLSRCRSLSMGAKPFLFGCMKRDSSPTVDKCLKMSDGPNINSKANEMPLTNASQNDPFLCIERDPLSPSADGVILTNTLLINQMSPKHDHQTQLCDSANYNPSNQNIDSSYGWEQRPFNCNGIDLPQAAIKESTNCLASDKCNSVSKNHSLLLLPSKECNENIGQSTDIDMISLPVGMPSHGSTSLDESIMMSSATHLMSVHEDQRDAHYMLVEKSMADEENQSKHDSVADRELSLHKNMVKLEFLEDNNKARMKDIMQGDGFDGMKYTKEIDALPVSDNLISGSVIKMKVKKQDAKVRERNNLPLHKVWPVKRKKLVHVAAKQRPFFCMLKPVLLKKISRKRRTRMLQ